VERVLPADPVLVDLGDGEDGLLGVQLDLGLGWLRELDDLQVGLVFLVVDALGEEGRGA
jgi:hypothetical protein